MPCATSCSPRRALERLLRESDWEPAALLGDKGAASIRPKVAPPKKPKAATRLSWADVLQQWATPLTAATAADATEQKVRWLLSIQAKSMEKVFNLQITERLNNWRPGKDCNCQRDDWEYDPGDCPCGQMECGGECELDDKETYEEMCERCLDYCEERDVWEDSQRAAVPDKLAKWVKQVLRIVVAEANAKPNAATKESMLVGARAAIFDLADFEPDVSNAVEELTYELDDLAEPEVMDAAVMDALSSPVYSPT